VLSWNLSFGCETFDVCVAATDPENVGNTVFTEM